MYSRSATGAQEPLLPGQYMAMALAGLTYRESLRGIGNCPVLSVSSLALIFFSTRPVN
jgi:hypothetical protein